MVIKSIDCCTVRMRAHPIRVCRYLVLDRTTKNTIMIEINHLNVAWNEGMFSIRHAIQQCHKRFKWPTPTNSYFILWGQFYDRIFPSITLIKMAPCILPEFWNFTYCRSTLNLFDNPEHQPYFRNVIRIIISSHKWNAFCKGAQLNLSILVLYSTICIFDVFWVN